MYVFSFCSSKRQNVDKYIEKITALSIGQHFSFDNKLMGKTVDTYFYIEDGHYEVDLRVYFLCSSVTVLRVIKYEEEYFAIRYSQDLAGNYINDSKVEKAVVTRIRPSIGWESFVKILEEVQYFLPSEGQIKLELDICCGGNGVIDGMEYYVEFRSLGKKYYYNNPKYFIYKYKNKELKDTRKVVAFLDMIREVFDIKMCHDLEEKFGK